MIINPTIRNAWLTAVVGVVAASAQTTQINANIRGGGGDSGKCTIEVEVDQVAEIEIRGTQARMRTIGGSPAQFRRMDCTGPLPANPANFNFSGVDGRGSQVLSRDPRQNRGAAVVRIDDRDGGREGYTFDITWSGAAGYGNNNGAPVGNGFPNGNNNYPPNGYPNNGNANNGYPNNGNVNNNYPNNNGGFGRDRDGRGYRYNDRNNQSRLQAMQNCQADVSRRVQQGNRYDNFQFTNTDVDDNRWRADRITGVVQATRRGRPDRYEYSCSVDLNSGRVLDVNLNRRR